MIKLKRGIWQQSLTVEEPDDYDKVMLTKTEGKRLTRFVQKFCPYKRGLLDPQRKGSAVKAAVLLCALILSSCAHHVTVPKQSKIPSPVIGHTICIDPADPTGTKIIPCPGGR